MLSNESPLLMDHMFQEVLVMERLKHEDLNSLCDDMERQFDGIMMPNGPRNAIGLATFLSTELKMSIASLLMGNPTLWHDLSD